MAASYAEQYQEVPEKCGRCRNLLVETIREVIGHHDKLKQDSETWWTKGDLELFLQNLLAPVSMSEIIKKPSAPQPIIIDSEPSGKEERGEELRDSLRDSLRGSLDPDTKDKASQIASIAGIPIRDAYLILRRHPSKGDIEAILASYFNGAIDIEAYRKMDSVKKEEVELITESEKKQFGTTKHDVEQAKYIGSVIGSDTYSLKDVLCVMRHHPKSFDSNAVILSLIDGVKMEEWRLKDDLLLKKQHVVQDVDCGLCYDTLKVTEMFTLDCPEAHRFCFECIQQHIEICLKEQKPAMCLGEECEHRISPLEVKQIFGEGDILQRFNEVLLRRAVENLDGCIGCPKPGCENWVVADTTTKVRCACNGCGLVFCSMCKENYHYGHFTCGEAKGLEVRWMEWKVRDRKGFASKEQEKIMKQKRKELKNRIKELEKDEAWKEQHLRLCPKCGRGIEKVSGCNAMVCGRDTHGNSNVQDGCGHNFNWTKAKAYKKAKWDKHMDKVDVSKVGKDDYKGVRKEHGVWNCDVCKEKVLGIRFSCINCPVYNVCQACEEAGKYEHHENHSFDIIKEEKYDVNADGDFVMIDAE